MNCNHAYCKLRAWKGHDGKPICLGDLHGVLFLGNAEGAVWDLEKNYTRYSEHSVSIDIEGIDRILEEDGEEMAHEAFNDEFQERVMEKLI